MDALEFSSKAVHCCTANALSLSDNRPIREAPAPRSHGMDERQKRALIVVFCCKGSTCGGAAAVDARRRRELERLLLTMSLDTDEKQTRILSELAGTDPEAAAKLALLIGERSEVFDTSTLQRASGLPARFDVARRLGQGGFGTVYEAFDRARSACRSQDTP